MNEHPSLSSINDIECVKMYVNFYKLLYLGTPFAEKMLNIKLEETKTKGKKKNYIQQMEENWDEEEVKGDSGSFVIDTSDISSSDGGEGFSIKEGTKKSPSSNDSISSSDPYQKIK